MIEIHGVLRPSTGFIENLTIIRTRVVFSRNRALIRDFLSTYPRSCARYAGLTFTNTRFARRTCDLEQQPLDAVACPHPDAILGLQAQPSEPPCYAAGFEIKLGPSQPAVLVARDNRLAVEGTAGRYREPLGG